MLTATDIPRALNEPVGFRDSSLTKRFSPAFRTGVNPSASVCVSLFKKWMCLSGRITHSRSAACSQIGASPNARLHSTIVV